MKNLLLLQVFFSPLPWPLEDIQNSIVLKGNYSGACVWGVRVAGLVHQSYVLRTNRKGEITLLYRGCPQERCVSGADGGFCIWLCRVQCGHEVKHGKGEGDAMDGMFALPSSYVEALTHTHTLPLQYDEPWR